MKAVLLQQLHYYRVRINNILYAERESTDVKIVKQQRSEVEETKTLQKTYRLPGE